MTGIPHNRIIWCVITSYC